MSLVPVVLLAAVVWALFRWDAFMADAERREIELAEPDELWDDIADATARSTMN